MDEKIKNIISENISKLDSLLEKEIFKIISENMDISGFSDEKKEELLIEGKQIYFKG
jgi:hypothetical protein